IAAFQRFMVRAGNKATILGVRLDLVKPEGERAARIRHRPGVALVLQPPGRRGGTVGQPEAAVPEVVRDADRVPPAGAAVGELLVIILNVHHYAHSELLFVAEAGGLARRFTRL